MQVVKAAVDVVQVVLAVAVEVVVIVERVNVKVPKKLRPS